MGLLPTVVESASRRRKYMGTGRSSSEYLCSTPRHVGRKAPSPAEASNIRYSTTMQVSHLVSRCHSLRHTVTLLLLLLLLRCCLLLLPM